MTAKPYFTFRAMTYFSNKMTKTLLIFENVLDGVYKTKT